MPVIRKLSPQLAERIAAGEVVERPASIVKELLENSLDAEATEINVAAHSGGMEYIDVRDNGCGIEQEQLEAALENHSTSKITSAEDLAAIQSLGFRGEALASIAAVSHLTLTSRAQGAEQAWRIEAVDGKRENVKPAALNQGGWIRVEKLFHNVPARRKFLRTPATEFAQLEKVFARIALSRHDVGFSLTHNGKLIHKLENTAGKKGIQERVKDILGDHFSNNSLYIDSETASYRLHGWIIQPAHAKSSSNNQYLYVNGRFIRDRIIANACKQGYGELLFSRLLPSYILFLEVPAMDVDVNVHPAKHEVRFRQGQLVHSLVRGCIKKSLERQKVTPISLSLRTAKPYSRPESMRLNQDRIYEGLATAKQGEEKKTIRRNHQEETERAQNGGQQEEAPLNLPLGIAVGLLHNVYVVAMNDKGLIVVDAHAAHERILFEKLKVEWRNKKWGLQPLLFPIKVELSPGDLAFVEENASLFAQWGFELRVIGTTTVAISSIPVLLSQDNMQELISSLSHLLQQNQADGTAITDQAADKILSSMACYGAVRANRKMTIAEMNALLRELEKTPRNYACNHGRPTWLQIDRSELDSKLLHGQ